MDTDDENKWMDKTGSCRDTHYSTVTVRVKVLLLDVHHSSDGHASAASRAVMITNSL